LVLGVSRPTLNKELNALPGWALFRCTTATSKSKTCSADRRRQSAIAPQMDLEGKAPLVTPKGTFQTIGVASLLRCIGGGTGFHNRGKSSVGGGLQHGDCSGILCRQEQTHGQVIRERKGADSEINREIPRHDDADNAFRLIGYRQTVGEKQQLSAAPVWLHPALEMSNGMVASSVDPSRSSIFDSVGARKPKSLWRRSAHPDNG